MRSRFFRPLLVVEFLIAIEAIFTLWSQVGGQYHLDLVYWPWKLCVALAAASLIVALTAALALNPPGARKHISLLAAGLVLVIALAGALSYNAHLNEPDDNGDDPDDAPAKVTKISAQPHPVRLGYQTLHPFPPRTIGNPSLHPNAF